MRIFCFFGLHDLSVWRKTIDAQFYRECHQCRHFIWWPDYYNELE